MFDIVATEAVHIPAAENDVCDRLSRQRTTARDLGYDHRVVIDLTEDSPLFQVLVLCDPTKNSPFEDEAALNTFWASTHALLEEIANSSSLLPTPWTAP